MPACMLIVHIRLRATYSFSAPALGRCLLAARCTALAAMCDVLRRVGVGPLDHLATGYLLASSINHGIRLADSPTLQYLFFLSQVGLSISPLSNNVLFCALDKNPFKNFMHLGRFRWAWRVG